MALTSDQATQTAQSIFRNQRQAERARLERIRLALKPVTANRMWPRPSDVARGTMPIDDVCGINIPADADPVMRNLAVKARTNYLPKVLDEYAAACIVQGYKSGRSSENSKPWQNWQANGLDGRQAGLNRVTFAYGVGYGVVLPGDTAPVMRFRSPLTMTAVYDDPTSDEWPDYALDVTSSMWSLYDDEARYLMPSGGDGTVQTSRHELGVCPVVRYRDRMLLEDEPMGIIEPLIPVQGRIDETTFGLLVAQHYAAFKQRAIIGWVPKTEQDRLTAGASKLWTFEDGPDDVKLFEFAESDLSKYIESGRSAKGDMASISHLPLQDISADSVANLAADALALLQSAKDDLANEMKNSMGESHEQFLRLSALAAGDDIGANDTASSVRWKDVSARSLAQTADALGKLATMLQIPPRALWSKITGIEVTDQDLQEWARLADQGDAMKGLQDMLTRQAQPPVQP